MIACCYMYIVVGVCDGVTTCELMKGFQSLNCHSCLHIDWTAVLINVTASAEQPTMHFMISGIGRCFVVGGLRTWCTVVV